MNYNPKWAITSKTVNACARWWRELSDFLSNTNPDRIFPRKEKFVFVEIRPDIGREVHMASQKLFSRGIIQSNILFGSVRSTDDFEMNGFPPVQLDHGIALVSP